MRRTWPLLTVASLPLSAALLCAQPPIKAIPPGGLPVNPGPAAPPAAAAPAPAAPDQDDETLLKAAKVGVDGPGLLEYFRQHTTPPAQRERIAGLIRQLGDDSFPARQKATDELASLGAAAVPYVRRALSDPDEEVKQRAEILIKNADGGDARAAQDAAAARLLRQRAPADAAAVLLAYGPDADGAAVEEVLASLAVLGVHDGKVDAPVLAALKDKEPAVRAAAAVAVGRSGTAERRADVQALLNDPDPQVRFRAAQGLLAGHDRAGVPVLVALVKDGPPDLASRSAELLSCAADVHAPRIPYGDDPAERQNCAKAWAAWAQRHAKTIDLSHAGCDLPAFNPALRARGVVRDCFNALVAGDLAAFKKAADAPFHMNGEQTYQTRDDLDRYFNENPMNLRMGPFYPVLLGTVELREYTGGQGANFPNGPNAPSDEAKFAGRFKPGDLAVFLLQQGQYGAPAPNPPDASQGVLFLVRVSGDQPRVVGVSPGRSAIKPMW